MDATIEPYTLDSDSRDGTLHVYHESGQLIGAMRFPIRMDT